MSTVLRRGLAGVLLLLLAPLILAIGLAILLVDGRPILYRGVRLGKGKRDFMIYKLRTLAPGAQRRLGPRLVSDRDHLPHPLGTLLRETRLDELPQLFNVLRGDMNFTGPRPERPEVYEAVCREIPGYDRRFRTKPGITGLSQLFTPHSTPKKNRVLLDNRTFARKTWIPHKVSLLYSTASLVLLKIGRRLRTQVHRTLAKGPERRRFVRLRPPRAVALLPVEELGFASVGLNGSLAFPVRRPSPRTTQVELIDINEEAFRLRTPRGVLEEGPWEGKLQIRFRHPKGNRCLRNASCAGEVTSVRHVDGHSEGIIHYRATTPKSEYVIDQYFLGKSVARFGLRRLS
jgi:lipopolysaccharide/colanic/teichoic acid biosynthesis glycosyltransferase